jgi:hypothetical protein
MILYDTKTLLFSSIEEYEKKIKKKISIKKNINNLNSDNDILTIRDNQQQNLKSIKSLVSARINIDKRKMNIINDNNDNVNDNENQNRNNKFISYLNNNNSNDYIISQKTKTDKVNNEYQ